MSRIGYAQTPAPLQEWQYSSSVPLEKLFDPEMSTWEAEGGFGGEAKPIYDGARAYRVIAGPIFSVRYQDIAFANSGEGIGVNVLRGENYRAGVALGYDTGRRVSDDETHLKGFTDIKRAPVLKMFGSYVVSKDFPAVIRVDVRQSLLRGRDGLVGDLGIYTPLPMSSEKFFWFAGPSVTLGDSTFMQKRFGVSAAQSQRTAYPRFDARAGTNAAGMGLTAIVLLSTHWIAEVDGAYDYLLKSARDSPITQNTTQRSLALTGVYKW